MARLARCRRLLPLGLLALSPLVALAQTASFNLPAAPLAESLKAIGAQTNVNVMVTPALVDGKQAPALKAKLSLKDALARVLEGSGLEYHFINDQTVVIRAKTVAAVNDPPPQQVVTPDAKKETGKNSSQDFRVAQVDQAPAGPQVTEERNGEKKAALEEVVVTGSRIPTAAGQQVLPVRSYTREDVERSGQTTVADFLNNLPDVSTSFAGREDGNQTGISGQTTIQLHGLPVGTTLVLLNGQRTEISHLGFFDLSNIPASAIERIEVLPVGASAVYGADALGGAVNIVTRKNIDGFEANAKFGHAIGESDTNANIAWGKDWSRGAVSVLATYQDRGELLGTEREPTSTIDFPPGAFSFLLQNDCAPGNIYSLNGQNLPGLSSPQAGIPEGISGTPTAQQFAATAGKVNQCNLFRNLSFIPSSQREGVLASAHYQIIDAMDLFTEVIFSHEHVQARWSPGLLIDAGGYGGYLTLGASNPYNPFGEAVGVSFSYPGIAENSIYSGTFIRPLLGVRGSIFSAWHYEATAFISRDRNDFNNPSGIDPNALQTALNSSDPATSLNPFTSGAPGTPQLLQSLASTNHTQSRFLNNQIIEGQALLRGPLLDLPAGPAEAVMGSEYSRQTISTNFNPAPLDLARETYAVFSEVRVPLLAERESTRRDTVQRGDRLALAFAGRYDHSNDFGGKATWQSGLLWRPVESLSFTGSYGISYRAPQLQEIAAGNQSAFPNCGAGYIDPFRGGQPAPVTLTCVFGSNPNLKAETGDSRTLGLKYSSQALPGLKASLTYFAVNISNYIASPDGQTLINNPNLYPGGVIRGPASPQDQQQGFLGPLTQINLIDFNFGDLHVAGFDADVSYAIDTSVGQLTPSLALANIYKWQSALVPGAPLISYVSQANGSPGFAPRWKGTAALNWTRGPLSANVAGRYTGRYKDYQYVPNTNELGNFWVLDANVRYQLGEALAGTTPWLARTYVALGVVDLLNKTPPFSNAGAPYDSSEYDIRGRFVYAQAGMKW